MGAPYKGGEQEEVSRPSLQRRGTGGGAALCAISKDQWERNLVGSSPDYSRTGVTPPPEAFSSPLLGLGGGGPAAGTLPPRAPPYKGGEQEEVSRPSLQRKGVRRDAREYSRLG